MNAKNKIVELPIVEPIYHAYHSEAAGGAILHNNPSIRNWYLNSVMQLTCNRKFIGSFTSPEIYIDNSSYWFNPYIKRVPIQLKYLGKHIHEAIRVFIDEGYYVTFEGIDDYYVEGKSFYKERHFNHDGLICGYNQTDKTYSILAYDKSWIYRVFKTPQKGIESGGKASMRTGFDSLICGICTMPGIVEIDEKEILHGLTEYLDSSFEKYPPYIPETAYGTVVHDYIAIYLYKQISGAFPYERIDKRVFRSLWEHKRAMLERIKAVETKFCSGNSISTRYQPLVKEAETMRMLYASHTVKRRDELLVTIQNKVLLLKEKEIALLKELVTLMKEKIK